jgi:hypothetical protein
MCGGPANQTAFYLKNISADALTGDDPRAAGAASGSAARGAAARYEAARRSCCMCPAASPARAASDPARDTPDSNTAPSNREDIASSRLAKCLERTAPKLAGLCAGPSSVSRGIYTISRGMFPASGKPASGPYFGLLLLSPPAGGSCACRSSTFFCAWSNSCCFASIWLCSSLSAAAPAWSEA